MSTVTMHRCDQCGKLAEAGDNDSPPKGWRVVDMPFAFGPGSPKSLEACSPGCAMRLLSDNVDAEWGVETGSSIVMSQESFDAIASATRSAA